MNECKSDGLATGVVPEQENLAEHGKSPMRGEVSEQENHTAPEEENWYTVDCRVFIAACSLVTPKNLEKETTAIARAW